MKSQSQVNKSVSISEEPPEGFTYSVEVVAAYVEKEGRLLFLRYSGEKKPFWAVPGGKIENGESTFEALSRELKEETGIVLQNVSDTKALNKFYVKRPGISYICHLFEILISDIPDITLSHEHDDFVWKKPLDAIREYPILPGAKEVLINYAKKMASCDS